MIHPITPDLWKSIGGGRAGIVFAANPGGDLPYVVVLPLLILSFFVPSPFASESVDVAPTLAELLGISMQNTDGKIRREILE